MVWLHCSCSCSCSKGNQLISETGCLRSRKDDSTRRSGHQSNNGRRYWRGSRGRSPP
jgi:hypothetical protein